MGFFTIDVLAFSCSLSTAQSPNSDRIAKISEKLNQIQVNSEGNRSAKLEQGEQRVKVLEEQYQEFEEKLEKKVNSLRDTISKLSKLVQEDRLNREHHFEQKQKEIYNLDQRLN